MKCLNHYILWSMLGTCHCAHYIIHLKIWVRCWIVFWIGNKIGTIACTQHVPSCNGFHISGVLDFVKWNIAWPFYLPCKNLFTNVQYVAFALDILFMKYISEIQWIHWKIVMTLTNAQLSKPWTIHYYPWHVSLYYIIK